MPVTIRLTFPAGRYHATPWGRHVNEGVAEWPPSPWRLLRALVAVWRRTCPDLPEIDVRRVLDQLVEPPLFQLPPHRIAHTRHYMPWEKKGPQDRTLVFDTFVSVARNTNVSIHWPNANLDASGEKILSVLLNNLNFLGRAEAWVEARIESGAEHNAQDWECVPISDGAANPLPVFCADPASCFADEYYPTLDAAKLAKGKVKPADYLFDCPRWHLCLDTETIHAERWPSVPGARWVNYNRPIEKMTLRFSKPKPDPIKPTVARFLLDGPALPLVTDTLQVADAMRRAVMSRFRKWCEKHPDGAEQYLRIDSGEYASPILSGKQADGKLCDGSGHAHYWPTASKTDPKRINGLTLFARAGFGSEEISALASLRKLMGIGELQVQLIGLGKESDLDPEYSGHSDVWQSVTPFLGHSEIGSRGQSRYLRKGIRREWRRLAEQVPQYQGILLRDIEELSAEEINRGGIPQPRTFRRVRSKNGGREAYHAGGMFRLSFSAPFPGPFSLGYANHFGMGQFKAV